MEQWLSARLAEVPPTLRRRVEEAVRSSGRGGDAPKVLRAAAEALLAEAANAPPGREAALTLLAADALMTYACEATAEHAPERLGDLR